MSRRVRRAGGRWAPARATCAVERRHFRIDAGTVALRLVRASPPMLIDDFGNDDLSCTLGTRWRGVSDRVMGGISAAALTREFVAGRWCLRLRGDVRLENNGGFVQAALDLAPDGGVLDASRYEGLRMTVRGNGERYGVHLRTRDCTRPWQSYRASFFAGSEWQDVEIAFDAFRPHRLDAPLDLTCLRRIGLVAIGRAFSADLALGGLRLYP